MAALARFKTDLQATLVSTVPRTQTHTLLARPPADSSHTTTTCFSFAAAAASHSSRARTPTLFLRSSTRSFSSEGAIQNVASGGVARSVLIQMLENAVQYEYERMSRMTRKHSQTFKWERHRESTVVFRPA